MKKLKIYIPLLLLGLVMSCQETEQSVATKPKRSAKSARLACDNQVSYRFLFPDNGYGYNGNGCISYHVPRGGSRQFKIIMQNITGQAGHRGIQIRFPNQPTYFNYTVSSVTGGTYQTTVVDIIGATINWYDFSMPAYSTYELILNVAGGPTSGENRVVLQPYGPCYVENSTNCYGEDELHLVLQD